MTLKKATEFEMAEEFQKKLNKSAALKTAFYALTPGRQRAYLLHFSQPKQSKTREARVEKYAPEILKGKGLNDL
ncbi:MAG: YdeI/OmpD-associated family protein [Ferruginibacter sp.]